jgi:hypothetical protein
MVFNLAGEQGTLATQQMVAHLQALPILANKLPAGMVKKLDNSSWEDVIDEVPVSRSQIEYFQTGGGSVSAAVEYFEYGGAVLPFHTRGYQLACSPGSNWGWWAAIGVVGLGAFTLGGVN